LKAAVLSRFRDFEPLNAQKTTNANSGANR
jgi:hypothetical protein